MESAVAHNDAGAKQTADSWMDARGGQEGGSAEHPGHRVRKTQTTPPNATAPTHPHRSVPRSKTHAQPPGPTTGQAKGPVCLGHRPGAGQATTQDDNARDPAPHGPPRAPAPRPSRRPEVPPYRQPERARAQKGGDGGPHLTPPDHQWPPTNTRSRGWEQGMTRCTYRAVAHQLMESRAPADQPRQTQDPTATRMHRMSTVSHQ